MVLKAARRYANAFLHFAIEKDLLEEILEDVESIHQTLENSRDLKLFLKSPIIKPEEKRKALESIFSESVQPITMQFLNLIIRKGRQKIIDQIMKGFIDLYKVHMGIIDIYISSARELPEDLRTKLIAALEISTDKKVDPDFISDEDLMGGIAVRIHDTVIDGTVKNKINRLRSLFKEAALNH